MTSTTGTTVPPTPGGKFSELGVSGLSIIGGRVNDEWLRALQGDRATMVWREMGENDAISAAMLYGLLQTVLRVDWTVDKGDALIRDATFLEQCKDDMSHPFRDVIAEAMTMCQFGWAWLETVYKTRNGPDASPQSDYEDGKIGWRKMPLRAQETRWKWHIDDEGGITEFEQRVYASDVTKTTSAVIPIDRSLLFRTTHHKNNPEGRSIFRTGYRSWFFRKRIEELEAIGIERDLAGLPVIGVPPEVLDPSAPAEVQAARAEWERIGRNIRNDEQAFVLMPMSYDDNGNAEYSFTLASATGRRLFDTSGIITRWAAYQMMAMMADVMMLGQSNVGSLALSRTKAELFTAGIQSFVDEIRDVINMFAVPRLFRLNGVKPPFPKFTTSPVERIDPGDFVTQILNLAQSGMPLWPDDDLDAYIRDFMGLPARKPDDGQGLEMIDPNAPTPDPKNAPAPPVADVKPTAGSPAAASPKAEGVKQGGGSKAGSARGAAS